MSSTGEIPRSRQSRGGDLLSGACRLLGRKASGHGKKFLSCGIFCNIFGLEAIFRCVGLFAQEYESDISVFIQRSDQGRLVYGTTLCCRLILSAGNRSAGRANNVFVAQ